MHRIRFDREKMIRFEKKSLCSLPPSVSLHSSSQPCSTGWTKELRHTSSMWALQLMAELLPSPLQDPVLESQPVVPVKKVVSRDKKDSGPIMRYDQDPMYDYLLLVTLWSNLVLKVL